MKALVRNVVGLNSKSYQMGDVIAVVPDSYEFGVLDLVNNRLVNITTETNEELFAEETVIKPVKVKGKYLRFIKRDKKFSKRRKNYFDNNDILRRR